MADLGDIGALSTGMIVDIVNPAATTTGTAQSYEFGVEAAPDGHSRTLACCVIGASAVPTTVTANLEASFNGGTDWVIYKLAVALVAATVATALITDLVAGPMYRLNMTTVTIGSAVTYRVKACLS
jgi:hypothetical protein